MDDDTPTPAASGRPQQPDRGEPNPYPGAPFQPDAQRPLVQRSFPITINLPGYGRRTLRRDVIAGVTVAALALPSGMAYAELAGLSPVAGLYALLLPAVAYGLLGSSRRLIVGPEGALAVMVAAAVAPLAAGDASRFAQLAALLAIITAAIYLIARVLRLGWIADYFSRPVVVGYIHGVAVVLILGQLEKLLGVNIDADDPLPQLGEAIREIGQAHGLTVLVGAVSLVSLVLIRRYAPKLPGPLVVVVAGIGVSAVANLAEHGVAVVGEIPAGLPTFSIPSTSIADAIQLLPAALGIFAVGFADGILTARSFAGRSGDRVRVNQELLALGAANAAAGVTQAFPVGASGSRTAVNDQIGGRTQIVGIVGAAAIALVLLFLTEPVSNLPSACLGAVIVGAAIGLIEPDAWRGLVRAGKAEVAVAATALIGVVVFGVLQALIVAVALSIVDVVRRGARPHDAVLGWVERLGRYADISLHPTATIATGVVVYRLDDRLMFANAEYVSGRIHEAITAAPSPTQWLVFDAEGVIDIDSSGIEMLETLIDSLATQGITLVLARLKGPLQAQLDAAGLTDKIGAGHLYPNVERAVHTCLAAPNDGTAGSNQPGPVSE